jgi:glycosyltransferase involved in cell wall biosynthesis
MMALQTPVVVYRDPWLLPLADRLAGLRAGRRRVLYYYDVPDSSTFRYRAYNMVQALELSGSDAWRGAWAHRADLSHRHELAELADVLVICRAPYDAGLAALMASFRARGKPVLFDVDDFVFDPSFIHVLMDTLCVDKHQSEFWRFWQAMLAGLNASLKACDASITTNEHLAGLIRDVGGHGVAIVPNFMNREQLDVSQRIFEEKQQRRFRGDGRVVMGYFSGSPSHQHDFAIAEPALNSLMAADERVHLMLVGYIEPGPALRGHADRILRAPMHDFVNLQRLIGGVEYNLMPLQANVFADAKSALKYFEAAAVGTVSIASPSYNYAAAIRDGQTGYLCQAQQWERRLGEMLSEGDGYADMAAAAQEDAVAAHGWRGRHLEIQRALDAVI